MNRKLARKNIRFGVSMFILLLAAHGGGIRVGVDLPGGDQVRTHR